MRAKRERTIKLRLSGMLVVAISLGCMFSEPATGCTVFLPAYYVTPNFSLIFKSYPVISRVRVILTPAMDSDLGTYIVITDDSGKAKFRDVKPGKYNLSAIGRGDFAEIQVGVGDSHLEVSWESPPILQTRALRGSFTSGGIAISKLRLQLKSADTGDIITEIRTTEDGHFNIRTPDEGIYILTVGEREGSPAGLNGDIPVRIDKAAVVENLDIEAGESSCGLMYSANCKSSISDPIVIRSLQGEVLDSSGAAIPESNWSFREDLTDESYV